MLLGLSHLLALRGPSARDRRGDLLRRAVLHDDRRPRPGGVLPPDEARGGHPLLGHLSRSAAAGWGSPRSARSGMVSRRASGPGRLPPLLFAARSCLNIPENMPPVGSWLGLLPLVTTATYIASSCLQSLAVCLMSCSWCSWTSRCM